MASSLTPDALAQGGVVVLPVSSAVNPPLAPDVAAMSKRMVRAIQRERGFVRAMLPPGNPHVVAMANQCVDAYGRGGVDPNLIRKLSKRLAVRYLIATHIIGWETNSGHRNETRKEGTGDKRETKHITVYYAWSRLRARQTMFDGATGAPCFEVAHEVSKENTSERKDDSFLGGVVDDLIEGAPKSPDALTMADKFFEDVVKNWPKR